ncbi:conserved hypothetical protein [Altererythrobacter sp. B11]|uniref:cupin domain-containing protein n=1 Tax=Altererythrobacter sp. B11 TaxID=2060312 RepID=UPI000DC6E3EA|nr:cupin domain-containing protein [Altererythrobacter sp. B11]BBC71566.1 conserved hypothetical protein [Altererythrobacter sp. B11]
MIGRWRGPGYRGARAATLLLVFAAVAANAQQAEAPPIPTPPAGANPVFHVPLSAAPGSELIATDLVLGPDAQGQAHYHPWEEYLYVLGGSAIVELDGAAPQMVRAGETFTIPARAVHTPRAGPQGLRAIILRVHRAGDPESVPVERKGPDQ